MEFLLILLNFVVITLVFCDDSKGFEVEDSTTEPTTTPLNTVTTPQTTTTLKTTTTPATTSTTTSTSTPRRTTSHATIKTSVSKVVHSTGGGEHDDLYEAKYGQFPFIVSIQQGQSGKHVHLCSGIIISDTHLLTAAECKQLHERVSSSLTTLQISAGIIQLESEISINRYVKHFVTHPEYNPSKSQNNIALIEIFKTFDFTDTVQLIPIHTEKGKSKEKCIVVGWNFKGKDIKENHLYWAKAKLIDVKLCEKERDNFSPENMICCSYLVRPGVCQGDIGGPLVCANKLAGVMCSSNTCGGKTYSVLADVSFYKSWITGRTDQSLSGKMKCNFKIFTFSILMLNFLL